MSTDTGATRITTAASDRVALRTMTERRRRVVRSTLTVITVMLAMVILSVLNRDRQAIDSCRERMEYAVKFLQENQPAWLKDASRFPLDAVRDRLGETWGWHVFENSRFTEQAGFVAEVGVCCCERPHSRLFRPGLRHVIVYHVRGRTYELKVLEEPEFARQAERLGLQGVLLFR